MLPGEHARLAVALLAKLEEIAKVEAKRRGIRESAARATSSRCRANRLKPVRPQASSSGLANYSRDSIQGAISNVPGIQQDCVCERDRARGEGAKHRLRLRFRPGAAGPDRRTRRQHRGRPTGTTGVGSETVTLGGYTDVSQNALGGVVNEVPLTGTYPGTETLEVARWNRRAAWRDEVYRAGGHAGPSVALCALDNERQRVFCVWRRPHVLSSGERYVRSRLPDPSAVCDRRKRAFRRYFDRRSLGRLFSPARRRTNNTIRRIRDCRWSTFNSPAATFPGEPANPNQQVDTPSIARGTYSIEKLQWVHDWQHSLGRLQLFQSQIGAVANGPEWDDLSFPDGVISLYSTQNQREDGIGYDFEDQANDKTDFRAGAQYDVNTSSIYQIVPTVPQIVTAAPRLNQYLVYMSDTWSVTPNFSAMGSLRYVGQHAQTSDNPAGYLWRRRPRSSPRTRVHLCGD